MIFGVPLWALGVIALALLVGTLVQGWSVSVWGWWGRRSPPWSRDLT